MLWMGQHPVYMSFMVPAPINIFQYSVFMTDTVPSGLQRYGGTSHEGHVASAGGRYFLQGSSESNR